MGSDYKCGCRHSFRAWFICEDHEIELLGKLEADYGE